MKKPLSLTGFTLIEIVMVIVVVGVISAAVIGLLTVSVDIWDFLSFREGEVSEARIALQRMIRETHQIATVRSVIEALPTALAFDTVAGERVRYWVSGDSLMRNNYAMTDNVNSLTLSYFDRSGNLIGNPVDGGAATDIWRIKVELIIVKGAKRETLIAGVHPRNFPRRL
ncbi:MAG: prepilin-type N-terminal cleavage/methylation domain-containing protein [Candidatus Omnitrophica bacterium]|nr:prepilin-type N-terminal cleavage/methylation domain-containing protein [Candidatus Omnitrophota bacterium]